MPGREALASNGAREIGVGAWRTGKHVSVLVLVHELLRSYHGPGVAFWVNSFVLPYMAFCRQFLPRSPKKTRLRLTNEAPPAHFILELPLPVELEAALSFRDIDCRNCLIGAGVR